MGMKKILRYCGLAALLAGAAFCLPNCDDNGTGPELYDGPWKIVPCPEGPSYLKGVFFLNPDLGYAVGCSYILKYEGEKWEVDYICEGAALEDVWFNAPDDGWVCGWGEGGGILLRYNGRLWERFEHNTPATSFYALHFMSANDGWAAGFGICHWNGTDWEYNSDLSYIKDIFFNSPTDGWAVSKYSERIYHYDGSSWTRVHEGSYPSVELYAVGFSSPEHGWTGGMGCISGTQSNLMEYRNGKWRYYQEPPWDEGIRRTVNAVHFSGPNNGWAVGQTTFRWDGERWWYVKPPPRDMHVGALNDIFTLSEDDAWAVGGARTILHYEP
jgi:photosystem II stability/assembly factor-like uncharacterized protein